MDWSGVSGPTQVPGPTDLETSALYKLFTYLLTLTGFIILRLMMEDLRRLWICLFFSIFVFISCCGGQSEDSKSSAQSVFSQRFKLEGKVAVPGVTEEWMSGVRILVDGGQYLGLVK